MMRVAEPDKGYGRRVPMFDAKELDSLDPKYFTIICNDIYDVTIKSNNTGHYW